MVSNRVQNVAQITRSLVIGRGRYFTVQMALDTNQVILEIFSNSVCNHQLQSKMKTQRRRRRTKGGEGKRGQTISCK